MNYEPFIRHLSELTSQEKRSGLQVEFIYNELIKITPLIEYIQERNIEKTNQILFELSKYLEHKKFNKGSFIRQIYDNDNYFCIVFYGQNVAKLEIAYSRAYLTYKQYILYLLKLHFLGEKNLLKYCIVKNRNIIPLNSNTSNFLTENKIYFYDLEEIIQNIKKNIRHSKWKSNSNKIEDFLQLYNPEYLNPSVKNNINSNFRKAKFPIELPYFIYDKRMEKITFIGELNKPKGIKTFSSFVCTGDCEVFYVELKKLNENDPKTNIYNLMSISRADIIQEKIYKSFFIFKDVNFGFLAKTYGEYFRKIILTKNQILIEQDKLYEGIFFIISGEYEVKTLKSYNELESFKFRLLHSIDNYPRSIPFYQPKMENLVNNKKYFSEKYQTFLKKFESLKKNANFVKKLNQKNEILIGKIQKKEIIGFENYYDPKNFINYFTVECVSDQGEVYFLQRELVTSLSSDDTINLKIGDIVGEHCTYFLNEINRHKEKFEKEVVFLFHNYNENNNSKNNTINNYFRKKMNNNFLNSEENMKNTNNYYNTNSFLSIFDGNTIKFPKEKPIVKLQKSSNNVFNKNKTQILAIDTSMEKVVSSNNILTYENMKNNFKRTCHTAKHPPYKFVRETINCKMLRDTVNSEHKKFIKRRTMDGLYKKFDGLIKNNSDKKEKILVKPLSSKSNKMKFFLSNTNQLKDNKIKLETLLGKLSESRDNKERKMFMTKSDMDFTKEFNNIKKNKNIFRKKLLNSKELSFGDNKDGLIKLQNFNKKI